jgi:hypothetical protein
MKKKLISLVCGGLAFALAVTNSFAQSFNVNQMEPVFITGTPVKVYENVQVEFHKQFPEAENVKWFKHDDKNYVVTFYVDDLFHRALLNRKGHVKYQICYGKEKDLPVDIRKEVKRMYVEHNITSASKVQEANRLIWVIQVEDDTNLVFVRSENGEIEEVHKYIKSKPQPQTGVVKQ